MATGLRDASNPSVTVHAGEILSPIAPTKGSAPEHASLKNIVNGALAVSSDGVILDVGDFNDIHARYPNAPVTRHTDALLMPGFVDTHLHFPQLDIIGCYGEKLLGWLERYTFPTETGFAEPSVATATASRFVTESLAHGTTLSCVYSSSHKSAAWILLEEFERRGARGVIGKVGMDRHAPPALLHGVAEDRDANEELIRRWHGRDGRLYVALTPRFAPSCTDDMMRMYGDLAAAHPDVFIQTHHAESDQEIAWVAELFPNARDYLDVYDRFGLLGRRTILAHSIHSTEAELRRMADIRPIIAHCPTSNMFLGSGLFPMSEYTHRDIPVTIASDIGGGTSISMWRTMAAAYDVQRLRGGTIPPAGLLYLATLAGAQALGFGATLGSLDVGKQADFQVVRPKHHRLLERRFSKSLTADEKAFSLAILADDRVVDSVFVRGREVYSKSDLA